MILFPCVVLCTLLDAAPRLIKTVSGISNTKHSLGIQGNNQRRAGTRQGNTRKYFLRQGIVGKEVMAIFWVGIEQEVLQK